MAQKTGACSRCGHVVTVNAMTLPQAEVWWQQSVAEHKVVCVGQPRLDFYEPPGGEGVDG